MERYLILDNGGYSFAVELKNNVASIYFTNEEDNSLNDRLIRTFAYKYAFVGEDLTGNMDFDTRGNSILLYCGKFPSGYKYISIGWKCHVFYAEYKIVDYVSNIGNSGVPYPYAVDSQDNIYLLLEYKIIPTVNENHDLIHREPYNYYYRLNEETQNAQTALRTYLKIKRRY